MSLLRVFSTDPAEETLASRLNVSRSKAYDVLREIGAVELGRALRVEASAVDRFIKARTRFGSRADRERQINRKVRLSIVRRFGGKAVLTRKKREAMKGQATTTRKSN